jgi:hypothetical protein
MIAQAVPILEIRGILRFSSSIATTGVTCSAHNWDFSPDVSKGVFPIEPARALA